MSDSLREAMDSAAAALLDWTKGDDTVEAKMTALEKVKAFEAVCRYLELRDKTAPPSAGKPKESKFDAIRRDFNGPKAPRKGRAHESDAEGSGSTYS